MTNAFHSLVLIGHRLATSHESASGTSPPLWVSLHQCLRKPWVVSSPNTKLLSGRSFCHCLKLCLKPQPQDTWMVPEMGMLASHLGARSKTAFVEWFSVEVGRITWKFVKNTHTSSTPTLLYSGWLKEDASVLILGNKNSPPPNQLLHEWLRYYHVIKNYWFSGKIHLSL